VVGRDYRDIAGGGLLILLGLGIAYYTYTHYSIGSMRQMGPGMFPAMMGLLLAALGVATLVPAFFRVGVHYQLEARPLLAIGGGLVSFPIIYPFLGLVPAIVSTAVLAGFADKTSTLRAKIVLGLVLSVICYLVFILGLRLPMATFRNPF